MTMNGSHKTIQALIEKYKQSAIAYYSACDDNDFAKQKTAGGSVNKIVQELDGFGAEGRLALIPLLDDPDQGVRTFVAADLLKIEPKRAIPVLTEISKGPTYFPRLDAGSFLESYAKGKWGK
jgi:hypothetical protein